MPITSAPIGRNRHMSISHRRDNPFIMAVIARHRRLYKSFRAMILHLVESMH